jgi:hypothetical protein
MKIISKLFLSLCLLMGLGAVMSASAQIASDEPIEVNIPFAFIVRDTTLPAGKYMIKTADDYDNLNVLEIRSMNGKTAAIFDADTVPVEANRRPSKNELIFDKVGDKYFLSQIFVDGDASGNQLIKSRMQQKLEGGGLKAERQSVAANRKQSKRSTQSAKKGS